MTFTAIVAQQNRRIVMSIRKDRLLRHCASSPLRTLACPNVILDGCTSFKILSNLDSILVEGAFDFLVESFILVVYEVHIIAGRV